MPRYHVNVDGTAFDIEVEYRSERYFARVNGREVEVHAHQLVDTRYLMLVGNSSYEVDVRSNGYDSSRMVFMLGKEIPVEIEDYNLAQLRKTAGMGPAGAVQKAVSAPMPGLILDVKVAPGDNVKKGQLLLVIEAMKMENVIKAQADAVVKVVHATKGASVDKGTRLVEFE